MSKHKIQKMTGGYEAWIINSLRDKKEASAYLKVALREYQKDNDIKALLLALRHVAVARNIIS